MDHTPEAALSSAWSTVLLPPTAQPAARQRWQLLVVWEPSTHRSWEFPRTSCMVSMAGKPTGRARRRAYRLIPASTCRKHGQEPGPGGKCQPFSVTRSADCSLSKISKRARWTMLLEMRIQNDLSAPPRSPAQRTDGQVHESALATGGGSSNWTRSLDLAALHLRRYLTTMLAEAAQRYGIFITDGSGASGIERSLHRIRRRWDQPVRRPDANSEGKPSTSSGPHFPGTSWSC